MKWYHWLLIVLAAVAGVLFYLWKIRAPALAKPEDIEGDGGTERATDPTEIGQGPASPGDAPEPQGDTPPEEGEEPPEIIEDDYPTPDDDRNTEKGDDYKRDTASNSRGARKTGGGAGKAPPKVSGGKKYGPAGMHVTAPDGSAWRQQGAFSTPKGSEVGIRWLSESGKYEAKNWLDKKTGKWLRSEGPTDLSVHHFGGSAVTKAR